MLGVSAGGVADGVRESRPVVDGGAPADDHQALGCRVVGRVPLTPFMDPVYDGDPDPGLCVHAGAGPAVLPDVLRT